MTAIQPPPPSGKSTSGPTFRRANAEDLGQIFDIRMSVTENRLDRAQLRELGITEESIAAAMKADLGTWVAESEGWIVGFSMAQADDGRVFALFVRPGCEGRGIGTVLLDLALEWLRDNGVSAAWLTTGEQTRAASFYERRGWSTDRIAEDGELRFEFDLSESAR